jgi:peptide/nickel transport system permease protein
VTVGTYVVRRMLAALPVLLVVTLLIFCLFRIIPGDPARLAAGKMASQEKVEELRKEMGFDKPLILQYAGYLRDVFRGDLGRSVYTHRPVISDFVLYVPATVELCLASMVVCLLAAIPLGVLAAVYENRWLDHASRLVSLSGVSVPIFWLGLLLQLGFYFKLGWLPASGRLSPLLDGPPRLTGMVVLDSLLSGNWATAIDGTRHMILPAFCLSFVMIGYVSRMTRSSMLEVLRQEYIGTARAKGLAERVVLYKHALRNALIPVVTVAGTLFAEILGGVVLTETIFSWKGLGSYLVESLLSLDVHPVAAFAMFSAFTYVTINLIVDVSYAFINPAVRMD